MSAKTNGRKPAPIPVNQAMMVWPHAAPRKIRFTGFLTSVLPSDRRIVLLIAGKVLPEPSSSRNAYANRRRFSGAGWPPVFVPCVVVLMEVQHNSRLCSCSSHTCNVRFQLADRSVWLCIETAVGVAESIHPCKAVFTLSAINCKSSYAEFFLVLVVETVACPFERCFCDTQRSFIALAI